RKASRIPRWSKSRRAPRSVPESSSNRSSLSQPVSKVLFALGGPLWPRAAPPRLPCEVFARLVTQPVGKHLLQHQHDRQPGQQRPTQLPPGRIRPNPFKRSRRLNRDLHVLADLSADVSVLGNRQPALGIRDVVGQHLLVRLLRLRELR